MSYEQYRKMLHDLYIYGKITYSVYSDMVKKKGKTETEHKQLYNSIRRGC